MPPIRTPGALAAAGFRFAEVEDPTAPALGLRAALLLSASGLLAATAKAVGAGGPSRLSERLADWHDRVSWPVRPVRIGIDLSSDLASMLIRLNGIRSIEWVPVPAGSDNFPECPRRALHGIIRRAPVRHLPLFPPL